MGNVREEFEKLPEIAERIKRSEAFYCPKGDWYLSPYEDCREDEAFLDGAWYAFQEQQKKLDCCREENKAHLEKIDTVLGILRNMKQYGVDEAIYILKGN